MYRLWGSLQARGGVIRAEGAFGHSIALGVSLAIAVPLVLATDLTARAKAVIVLILMAGTVVSFSRAGMLCAVLGMVLTIAFQRSGLSAKLRVLLTIILLGVAFVALPYVSAVFEAAGDEAAGSAAYRGNLLSLVPDMAPLGLSGAAYRAPDGRLYMGNFRSIDSALILEGLTYGWLPLVVTLFLLLTAVGLVVTRRAAPPTVAIVTLIPALASVALITQYASVVWMIVGMAIYAQTKEGLLEFGVSPGRASVRSGFSDDRTPPPRLRLLSDPDPVAEPMDPPSSDADVSEASGRASAPSREGSRA